MAAPNIYNTATIIGKTTYSTPSTTNAGVLLANPASSNKVFKINSLTASNIDGTAAADVTVAVNTNAAGSGTGYAIVSTLSVPADATLIVIDKDNQIYLEEDKSIVVTSGTANDITFVISYEEMS
jgi:hypothetical protein